jgi:hypothetical protein
MQKLFAPKIVMYFGVVKGESLIDTVFEKVQFEYSI